MKQLCSMICTASLGCLFLAGCQNQQADKQKAVNLLFGSVQRLQEASSVSAEGTLSLPAVSLKVPFTIEYDQNPLQAALTMNMAGTPVDFYIRDGHTYLNYMGTTSQSDLSNLISQADNGSSSEIPNPFLDLSNEERLDLFESISLSDDTYTYVFKKEVFSQLLDSYQTLTINKAQIQASFDDDGDPESYGFVIDATANMDGQSANLSIKADVEIESMNEPLTIDFPEDLASWPVQ